MASWRNARMVTTCPECQSAPLRLARQGGKTRKEERIYHCVKCGAVFNHSDLVIHWPRQDTRPALEVVVSFGGYLKVKPIGHISDFYV